VLLISIIEAIIVQPADGWKPGPMNEEKERIKELCHPVIEWVKTMK
jgi:hypothetical protein